MNELEMAAQSGSEIMTSSQLAEMLGKEKKYINRAIREVFGEEKAGADFAPSLFPNGYVNNYHNRAS